MNTLTRWLRNVTDDEGHEHDESGRFTGSGGGGGASDDDEDDGDIGGHDEDEQDEDGEAFDAWRERAAPPRRVKSRWRGEVSPARRRAAEAVDRLSGEAQARLRGHLAPLLERLGQRAAALVRDSVRHGRQVSPSELAHGVIDRHAWERELAVGLREVIGVAVDTGAAAEWELYREFRAAKGFRVEVKMPNRFWQVVRDVARQLSGQTTVRGIIETVVQGVRRACRKAQAQGKTGAELADAVNQTLVGPGAERTARVVARNEGAGAVNAGQTAVRDELTKLGKVAGSQWVCVDDNRTRPTHRAADGQLVQPGVPFVVGGFKCKHPGDASLPPQEREHCRCRAVTIFK